MPSVIHDPTGSTYTLDQIQALLHSGFQQSTPASFTDGNAAPDPSAIILDVTKNYLVETIAGWWCLADNVVVTPGMPVSSDPLRPYANLIHTTVGGWLDLALANREVTPAASGVDPGAWTDNVNSTNNAGSVALAIAIRGSPSQRRAILAHAELEAPSGNVRAAVLTHAELEAPDPAGARRAIITHAELQAPDYRFPGQIGYMFHKSWARYRYFSGQPSLVTTRRAVIGQAELEAPVRERRALITHAQLEAPPGPQTLLLGCTHTPDSEFANWTGWFGRQPDVRTAWTNKTDWSTIADSAWPYLTPWLDGNPNRFLNIGISMCPFPTGSVTLQQVANGLAAAETAFRSLANKIMTVYRDRPHSLRVGWEMNGTWYPWQVINDDITINHPNADYFAAAFRKIREWMDDEQPLNQWTWAICPTDKIQRGFASNRAFLDQMWPGDAWCDQVQVDIYDRWNDGYPIPAGASAATIAARRAEHWTWALGQLNTLSAFAAAHGKTMAVPEWGVVVSATGANFGGSANPLFGIGGGDNESFIQGMNDWMRNPTNNVTHQCYFDSNYGSPNYYYKLSPGGSGNSHFPLASAKYKLLFDI
jgi:hypothetical protein